jgi:hypothetical protein
MINDGKKKMGFLNQFRAFNVNISEPETDRKWNTLRQLVQAYSPDATTQYPGNLALARMTEISTVTDSPDELMEFGKNLQAFVESANKTIIKEDKSITKIVELFATTAKLSNDQRIISAAIDISNAIIALKKEKI